MKNPTWTEIFSNLNTIPTILGLLGIWLDDFIAEKINTSDWIVILFSVTLFAYGLADTIRRLIYYGIENMTYDMLVNGVEKLYVQENQANDLRTRKLIFEILETARRAVSVSPINSAIEFIWRRQDGGRLPPLDNIDYDIRIYRDPASDNGFPTPEAWQGLHVDYVSGHGFKVDDNFFSSTEQKPADLLRRLIRPIVILPYEHYVHYADTWDRCHFTVVYPITRKILEHVKDSTGTWKKSLRKILWLKSPSKNTIEVHREAIWAYMTEQAMERNEKKCSEREDVFYMFIGAKDTQMTRTLVEFKSIFNSSGELLKESPAFRQYLEYMKTQKDNESADLVDGLVQDSSKYDSHDCFVAGVYMPIIDETVATKIGTYNEKDFFSDTTDSANSKLRMYSIWSYTTIEKIESENDKFIHEQNFFNFAVDYCAYLDLSK